MVNLILADPVVLSLFGPQSRRVLASFRLKTALALLLSAFTQPPHMLALATWLSLLALATCIQAFFLKVRFRRDAFCAWDEALWLMFLAHMFRLLHGLIVAAQP